MYLLLLLLLFLLQVFIYLTRLIIPLALDLDLFKISIILRVALCCVLKMACSLKHGVERCLRFSSRSEERGGEKNTLSRPCK